MFALFLLLVSSAHANTVSYNCSPSHWVGEASVNDGLFTGTREVECILTLDKPLKELASFVNYKANTCPRKLEGPTHVDNDTTEYKIAFQTENIDIDEIVTVKMEDNLLTYHVISDKITGSGTNAYLRKLEVLVKVQPMGNAYKMVFRSTVNVERPWYALAIIFEGIVRGKVEEKVDEARDKFMTEIRSF